MDEETHDGPPRALLIAAIVVAVGAIIGILVVAVLRQSPPGQQPVAIASVPAPKGDSAECRALLGELPDQLGDYRRAPAAQPAPQGAAAWTAGGELLGDDFGAAHLGLDQHESLDHPFPLRLAA